MAISSKPIVNFAGGECSPRMYGRTDVVPYFACAKTLENVLTTHYGGAFKTPGTHFVAKSKGSGVPNIFPFIYSSGDSYILEFGNLYMRVFRTGGSVVETAINISNITNASQAVVTLSGISPSNGDVVDIEGVVGMTQVNEKRFIVSDRTSNTFKLKDEDGVYVDSTGFSTYISGGTIEKVYQITTPYATADLGNIRFAQKADIVYIDCKGHAPRKLSRYGSTNWTLAEYTYDTFNWPPFGDLNSTATTLAASATTGSVTLTASASLFTSGMVGTFFMMAGGYLKVTAYTSATQVTALVIATLTSGAATTSWREGMWSANRGYPEDCTFYENRLYHVATASYPLTMWGSVIEEYENNQFGTGTSGAITDEDAVTYEIGSNQVDKILWIYPTQVLNMGTAGGPFTASSGSASDPITSTNISVKQQNENGSANIVPIRIGSFVYYVERSGKVLGQFAYSLDQDAYITDNVTYLNDHILGDGVKTMAVQRYPYNTLWCVLNDGTIATFTREQKNEVKSWTRQVFSGTNVKVLDVAVIPNGVEDQVWLVVERTIDGVTRRYIEYVSSQDFGTVQDAFFVQSGLTYSGSPTTTLTNLDHLEGESVQILADGAVHPNKIVTNGTIALDWAASKVHIGLGYTAKIETLNLEEGSATGSAQAKPKHISKANVRLHESVGCKVGTPTNQDTIPFRNSSMLMNQPVPLFSGDKEIVFPAGWERDKNIVVLQEQPLPMHVLAIYPRVLVSD